MSTTPSALVAPTVINAAGHSPAREVIPGESVIIKASATPIGNATNLVLKVEWSHDGTNFTSLTPTTLPVRGIDIFKFERTLMAKAEFYRVSWQPSGRYRLRVMSSETQPEPGDVLARARAYADAKAMSGGGTGIVVIPTVSDLPAGTPAGTPVMVTGAL